MVRANRATPTLGTKIKCNPAIKTAADRDALRAAVVDDRIDVIATDHAPHTLEEKARSYFEAPSGLPLVQHSLLMLLDQHAQGLFTLPKIVEKAAHNPALLFGIAERGFLREGYYADLVAVDLAAATRVDAAQVRSKCGWSPFEGTDFRGGIVMTVLNGAPVFRDGQPVAGPRAARALEFRGALATRCLARDRPMCFSFSMNTHACALSIAACAALARLRAVRRAARSRADAAAAVAATAAEHEHDSPTPTPAAEAPPKFRSSSRSSPTVKARAATSSAISRCRKTRPSPCRASS